MKKIDWRNWDRKVDDRMTLKSEKAGIEGYPTLFIPVRKFLFYRGDKFSGTIIF